MYPLAGPGKFTGGDVGPPLGISPCSEAATNWIAGFSRGEGVLDTVGNYFMNTPVISESGSRVESSWEVVQ